MSCEMNRRGFIKGAGVFAVVALCAALVSSGEIATSESQIKPPSPNVMRTEANSPVVKEVRTDLLI